MNILFVNSQKVDEFGGGEQWVITTGVGLQDRRHRVWICGRPESRLLESARKAGLDTLPLRFQGDFDPYLTWKMRHFLRSEAIDVLVCNFNRDVRVAGLAGRLARTPAIFVRCGLNLIDERRRYILPIRWFTDGVITNTESIRRPFVQEYGLPDDFVTVVHNGVDQPDSLTPEPLYEEYGGRHVILSAGRLTGQKGFDVLIQAAAELRSRRDDFVVLIAGDGVLENQLQGQIAALNLQGVVHLIGFRSPLAPAIAGATVFVLASRYEGMPRVLIEAMSVGTPVVATDVNGAAELIPEERFGLLVPPDDAVSLAMAIERLLDDPTLARGVADAARARVLQKFTVGAMVDGVESLFERTVT
ncbi:MAG: glycosyltransferase [Gemmatimonadales bacterium]|nr:MAG: glycosyltransferase [Gemmatimonadales bacterium]